MQVTNNTTATSAADNNHRRLNFDGPKGQELLQALSQKLGMSADDLKAQVDAGADVRDIAKAKGISPRDLFQAIRGVLGEPPQQAQGTKGHHRHHEQMDSTIVDAVAGKLGMKAEDLTAALQSGKGLKEIASDHGVSEADLVQTLQQAFQQLQPYDAKGQAGGFAAAPAAVDAAA
jgi:uncharacterized protein YidB (DUF937 family)